MRKTHCVIPGFHLFLMPKEDETFNKNKEAVTTFHIYDTVSRNLFQPTDVKTNKWGNYIQRNVYAANSNPTNMWLVE